VGGAPAPGGARGRGWGARPHDAAWNPDDFAVESDFDRFLGHALSMAPSWSPANYFRGLNA
jgi:hypothetical protein